MPYFHCQSCHHEWEGSEPEPGYVAECDWCGGDSYVLEAKTPLELTARILATDPKWQHLVENLRKED